MKIRLFSWLMLVCFTAFCLLTVEMHLTQTALAEKTVRLHVVANSDSDEDQTRKLRVRDAVLCTVNDLTSDCSSAAEARTVITDNLEKIQTSAQAVLDGEHCTQRVSVSLGYEDFDTRYYDTFTLPAGSYPALRVKIGAANGKNWWCVVFPTLCTAATAEELAGYAQAAGFDESETNLISGDGEGYVLRLKSFEWLQDFLAWIS